MRTACYALILVALVIVSGCSTSNDQKMGDESVTQWTVAKKFSDGYEAHRTADGGVIFDDNFTSEALSKHLKTNVKAFAAYANYFDHPVLGTRPAQ